MSAIRGWNLGRLSTSADASESFFQSIYDPGSPKLAIERAGVFWEAAQVASNLGLRGRGRRIAIIDAGFDMTIKPLAAAASPKSIISPKTIQQYGHHGSVVALLIHEVAPEAELVLIDIAPVTRDSIASALELACDLKADIVNMSLEFKSDCPVAPKPGFDPSVIVSPDPGVGPFLRNLDIWIRNIDIYTGGCRKKCKVCDAVRALPTNMLLISAAGNMFCPACPASNDRCLGIGFERQTLTKFGDGELLVRNMPSGFDQDSIPELTIPQPAGFLGTSFASPLVTALAAVIDDPHDILVMGKMQFAMFPVLLMLWSVQRLGQATKTQIESLHRGFLRLFDEILPRHRHWETNAPLSPCVICSMFMEDWYRDIVAFLASTGNAAWADRLGSVGEAVAPYSAEVAGNHGVALLILAESARSPNERRRLLQEAAKRYRKANDLRPQIGMYIKQATAIETDLARQKTTNPKP